MFAILGVFALTAAPVFAQSGDMPPSDAPNDAPRVVPSPEGTDPVDEGFSLLQEGGKLMLRGLMDRMGPELDQLSDDLGTALSEMEPVMRDLMEMVGDIRNYEAPEKLPNGDIIIRRKSDADPIAPGPGGEIEL